MMAIEVQELKPDKGPTVNPTMSSDRSTEGPPKRSEVDHREPIKLGHDECTDLMLQDLSKIESANAVLKRQNISSKKNTTANKTDNQQIERDTTIEPSVMVYMATFGALLGALSMGLALGYTAPAFVDMEKEIPTNNSILDPDSDRRESQKSLIGSTLAIGALVAALAGEPCNNSFGRRIPLILCGVPFVIGWLLLTFADRLALLVLGRLIIGACCGIACGTAPTYVVEIAPPQIRGALGTCFQLMVVIGQLLSSILGMFMSWRMLAAVSLIPGIGMTIVMLLSPESPTWLVGKQRREEAIRALGKFRKGPIEVELNKMIVNSEQESSSSAYSLETLQSKEFLKPLAYALGLMFFQQFTGINAVIMYLSDIFKEASPDSDALMSTIWVCLAQVVATVVCSLFVDKLGRRILLWISGAGCMLTLLSLGTYSHLAVNNKTFQEEFAIVPLISLILYITFFSFGFGPITWMMIPELASARVRTLIASFGALFAWTGAYVVTAFMKPLKSLVGDDWTYWLLSAICAASILYIIILPETKAKKATVDQGSHV